MIKYLFISIFVVLFDQASKIYIKTSFLQHESIEILGSLLKFTYIENPGIVFGIDINSFLYKIITSLSFIIILYIYTLMKKMHNIKNTNLALISLSLILGGAIGNIIDRFFVIFELFDYSGVIDFIDIGTSFYRFYIFNIADMCVTIGIVLFVIYNYSQRDGLNANESKI